MRTPTIIYKNLRQRALSTILTACSIALGVALVVAITSLRQQAQENFNSVAGSYELVIGAKGSPLQLVLNTVYHLDVPVGNIPYGYYQTLKNDWRVQSAIPLALGDNYHGFRLVGTEPEYFTQMELQGGKKLTFAAGKSFAADYEAVLGSQTARQTGLKLGDKFVARHGIEDTTITEEHTEHPCTVTGILNETGTPQDRVIFITIGSVHELHVPDPTKPLTGSDLLDALQKLPTDQPATTKETDHDHHHRESSPQPPA
ncbi:MAG TPA: ABC transporter permease, partial [Acidobacteriota bacterium]|nr:ABC transporter permease [Acidobacteriota bacterium]